MNIKVNSVYQHYKGNLYKIIGLAKDAIHSGYVVVYKNIEFDDLWVRPIENFTEVPGIDSQEGINYPRFFLVDISCIAWKCLIQSLHEKCEICIMVDDLLEELDTNLIEIARTFYNTCIEFEALKNISILIKPMLDYKHLSSSEYYSIEQWFDVFGEVGFSGYLTVNVKR